MKRDVAGKKNIRYKRTLAPKERAKSRYYGKEFILLAFENFNFYFTYPFAPHPNFLPTHLLIIKTKKTKQ